MSEQLLKTPCTFGENGNFLLERELGRGGMGGVYMGRDKMLDRPVAVKVMLKEYGADAEFVERFKKEAQAVAKLIHPNIAQIYSYGISDGMPYIAMELVPGGSLWTVMQAGQGKADVTRVLKICQQVAQALQCSTDQGFVHGDIKPENILLDANGNAKLVDFGLAGMQKDTDEIWGTPYYISPEKVRQSGVDFRSDMYNLGGTLYHALTNKPPFDGADVNGVVKARFSETPKKPSEIRPELTPAVDALVMRMLEQDKEKRFPSFEALIDEFKRVLTSGLEKKGAKVEGEGQGVTEGATGTGTVKRVTTVRGGRRVTTVRRRVASSARPVDPDLDGQKDDEEDEKSGGVGGKILGFVFGGIALIGAVIGGLVWFQISTKNAEAAAYKQQIADKISLAHKAIAANREQALKFADEFDEFAAKAVTSCQQSTDQLKKLLPDWADEMKPAESDELLKAIASTNETPKVEEKVEEKAKVEGQGQEKEKVKEEVKGKGEGEEKAKPKKITLAARAKRCGLEVPADLDTASPEYKDFMDKLEAKEKELEEKAKAEEKAKVEGQGQEKEKAKGEGQDEGEAEKKPDKPRPQVLDDMKDLWDRAYSCQASAIKIRHRIRKVVSECDAALQITGEDEVTMGKLADVANKTTEAIGEIKNCKDVENVRKGITFIKQKGDKTIEKTVKRLRIEKLEAERKAKKEAEEAAEKAKKEAEAAAKAKLIEEESAAAKAKFDSLVAQGVFQQLDWESALRQLKQVKDACKSPEGGFAADYEIHKVETMKKVQDIFKENLPGYVFKKGSKKASLKGNTVRTADGTMIETVRADGKTPQKLSWRKFYKEYHGNLNELINTFVVKGRDNGKHRLNLKEWADAMCGAALSMRIICGDSPTAAAYGETLVKQVYEKYPDYQKNLKAMFPDVAFEGGGEGATDENKAEEAKTEETKEENT